MVSDKTDKKRRKSIAAISHARPNASSTRRRRAHSMIPGSNSPLARRILQPRKSILKIPVTIVRDGESLSARTDTSHGTESMDLTRRESVHMGRKSLGGGRVSFAAHAHVRMFSEPDNTVSSIGSADSPSAPTSTNENDYPGAKSRRRRSSARTSIGTQDMDITERYEFSSDDDYSSSDPLREENLPTESLADESMSTLPDQSHAESDLDGDGTQHMEYTIPMGQALKPAQEDPTYVALMQATHAGVSDFDGEMSGESSMDLDEASLRIARARASLPGASAVNGPVDLSADHSRDSLSSMDQDDEQYDAADKTVNLSKILGRASFGGMSNRTSFAPSSMDITDNFTTNTFHSTPRHSMAPSELDAVSPFKVDVPPLPSTSSLTRGTPTSPRKLTIPRPFVFSKPRSSPDKGKDKESAPTPTSPSKSKSKFPSVSAASATRHSPKKAPAGSQSAGAAGKSPNKRPRESENDLSDAGKPSPAKRQAVADKWSGPSSAQDKPISGSKPKPLSPSKRAPFQPQTQQTTVESEADRDKTTQIRQPSGYFARRKSFMPVSSATAASTTSSTSGQTTKVKQAAGRLSTGTAPSDAWLKFDKNAPAPTLPQSKRTTETLPQVPVVAQTSSITTSQEVPDVEEVSAHDTGMEHDSSLAPHTDLNATERWRTGVPQSDAEPDQPHVSIKQFFEITEVAFMDELQAPRRSMHPRQSHREARQTADIPLAEYAVSLGVDLPQLNLYKRVAEDLGGWIHQSKTVSMKQAEEEAALVTPELFVEYVRADEDGQADIVHQLKLIKTNTRAKAKSDWYEWKLRWIQELEESGTKVFESLTQDAQTIASIQGDVDTVLPDLQQRYVEIAAQLKHEQDEVAQIEASDHEFLNELKTSIKEQEIEVESLRVETNEHVSQLRWLEERLVTIEAEEKGIVSSMAEVRRINDIRMNSTQLDVFRLSDELQTLEELHMTKITKVQPHIFEYIYASQFRVTIPCREHLPIMSRLSIEWLPESKTKYKDGLPGLRNFFLFAAKEYIVSHQNLTTRQIVQLLSDFWSSCGQLRRQLEFLKVRFPIELEFSRDGSQPPAFTATASMLFLHLRARAEVTFNFPLAVFASWPRRFEKMQHHIETAYGPVKPKKIEMAVLESLRGSRPEHNQGWLLDACSLVVDSY